MKFCIQSGESTREKIAIFSAAHKLGYEYTIAKICLPDHIPIGTVEFCESILPKRTVPIDFYPEFLKDFRHREIGYAELKTIDKCLFLKKANEWKSDFQSRIVKQNETIPHDWYYYSEPVEFLQEWRYYIAAGVVITTGWYDGENEDEPAPELNVRWPKNFNAVVDFGRLSSGEIALVEAHAPFACGWYGENHEDYVFWQHEAWSAYLHS